MVSEPGASRSRMTFQWIASYGLRGLSENRQQFWEYISPLLLCALRKTEKELPIKRASLEKIQKPPPKNVCPQIGDFALTT